MCFIILVYIGQLDLTLLSFLSSDVSGNIAEVWVVGCVLVAGSRTQHFVSWNYDMATVVLRWLCRGTFGHCYHQFLNSTLQLWCYQQKCISTTFDQNIQNILTKYSASENREHINWMLFVPSHLPQAFFCITSMVIGICWLRKQVSRHVTTREYFSCRR